MNKRKVFVSSILDWEREDLSQERRRAIEVVNSYGFLETWAFENEPASSKDLKSSYLDAVTESDIVVVILGRHLTKPVKDEFDTARAAMKPKLLFLKKVPDQTPEVNQLAKEADVKYARFDTLEELASELRRALDQEIARALTFAVHEAPAPNVATTLPEMAKRKQTVHVTPLLPVAYSLDPFTIEQVEQDSVLIRKASSDHQIWIPTGRVSEILHQGPQDPVTLILRGRLQWLSPSQEWRFFLESPTTEEERQLGLAKWSSLSDPRAHSISARVAANGYHVAFARSDRLPALLSSGCQLIYDADGLYFRVKDTPHDQVLVMCPR